MLPFQGCNASRALKHSHICTYIHIASAQTTRYDGVGKNHLRTWAINPNSRETHLRERREEREGEVGGSACQLVRASAPGNRLLCPPQAPACALRSVCLACSGFLVAGNRPIRLQYGKLQRSEPHRDRLSLSPPLSSPIPVAGRAHSTNSSPSSLLLLRVETNRSADPSDSNTETAQPVMQAPLPASLPPTHTPPPHLFC